MGAGRNASAGAACRVWTPALRYRRVPKMGGGSTDTRAPTPDTPDTRHAKPDKLTPAERLAKAKATAIEIRLHQRKGDILSKAEVETEWTRQGRAVRAAMLEVPAAVAIRYPGVEGLEGHVQAPNRRCAEAPGGGLQGEAGVTWWGGTPAAALDSRKLPVHRLWLERLGGRPRPEGYSHGPSSGMALTKPYATPDEILQLGVRASSGLEPGAGRAARPLGGVGRPRYPGQALMALWINCSGCDRGSASARLGPGGDSTQAERARRRAEDFRHDAELFRNAKAAEESSG